MMLKSSRLVALTLAATFTMAPATTVLSQTNNQKDLSAMSNTRVKLVTNMGDIVLELDGAKAPITTQNFLDYVKNGFYSNVIFHRVIPNFMIQGGGFEPGMNQKNTNAPITNEADNGLKNDKYTIAMARTQDPHSASAQFFINTNDNDFLNFTAPSVQGWGYAVFGKVVEGTEVVDAIEKVATGTRGFHGDVPREDVIIQSAEIVE
ncbi:Peptidyl-prolyl cis-trans isomerase B [Oligella urethralis]|uniref:peptidylprolyl isomerase n=1 Tax=Oligella urethralis TaxID=90245 RepID=UPI0029583B7A|nr:peptidylprolyl isomerase [Oligella urethralis]WOS37978.1 Peptidyl-prolyl cis-trans isomerase B [Oligella urethralis]